MTQALYTIVSKATNKIYIGSSVNVERRFGEHLSKLRLGKHDNPELQSVYNKHGAEDLIFNITIQCDDIKVMRTLEFDEIKKYKDSQPTKLLNIIGVVWVGSGKRSPKTVMLDEIRKEIIWQLSSEGYSQSDIAKILNCGHRSTIYRSIKKIPANYKPSYLIYNPT